MKTVLFIILGLVFCAFLAAGFFGCQRARSHSFTGEAYAEKKVDAIKKELTRKLELSETQAAQVDRILATMKNKRDEIRGMHQEMRAAFLDELRKDQVSPGQIKQLIESRRPVFDEMITMLSQGISDFHGILTPEQREKLIAEIESHEGHCRFGRHWQ